MRYGSGGANIEIGRARFHHDGVITELKQMNFGGGGQNVRVFNSTVEWTYSISHTANDEGEDLGYGNSGIYSAYASTTATHSGIAATATCYATYTFSEPLQMKAGQTLSIAGTTNSTGRIYVFINGTQVYDSKQFGSGGTPSSLYTFPSDTSVTSIEVESYVSNAGTESRQTAAAVTVNSDIGSFLLNNSGTSDGQT